MLLGAGTAIIKYSIFMALKVKYVQYQLYWLRFFNSQTAEERSRLVLGRSFVRLSDLLRFLYNPPQKRETKSPRPFVIGQ